MLGPSLPSCGGHLLRLFFPLLQHLAQRGGNVVATSTTAEHCKDPSRRPMNAGRGRRPKIKDTLTHSMHRIETITRNELGPDLLLQHHFLMQLFQGFAKFLVAELLEGMRMPQMLIKLQVANEMV